MQQITDVERTVKTYILNEFLAGEDASQLTPTSPLVSNGILDSLATLKLISFLEQEFKISIAAHEADFEHLESIERIAKLVASKR